jgi:hypothetical protein
MKELEQIDNDLKIYDKRIDELKLFLSRSTSQTQKDLIKSAIAISESNLNLYNDLLKCTVNSLALLNTKIKSQSNQVNLDIDKLKLKIDSIKHDIKLKKQYSPEFDKTEKRISIELTEIGVNRVLYDSIIFSTGEFQRVLFQCIYLPSNEQFKLDAICELLKNIAMRMIPNADSIETILNMNIAKRKLNNANEADKFLIYLEKYLNASELWHSYANKYKELL